MTRKPEPPPEEIYSAGYITARDIQSIMGYAGTQLRDMLPMGTHDRRGILDWFDDVRMKLLSKCAPTPPRQAATATVQVAEKLMAPSDPLPDSRQQYAEYQQRVRGRTT